MDDERTVLHPEVFTVTPFDGDCQCRASGNMMNMGEKALWNCFSVSSWQRRLHWHLLCLSGRCVRMDCTVRIMGDILRVYSCHELLARWIESSHCLFPASHFHTHTASVTGQ
jgi:hypothetical protein